MSLLSGMFWTSFMLLLSIALQFVSYRYSKFCLFIQQLKGIWFPVHGYLINAAMNVGIPFFVQTHDSFLLGEYLGVGLPGYVEVIGSPSCYVVFQRGGGTPHSHQEYIRPLLPLTLTFMWYSQPCLLPFQWEPRAIPVCCTFAFL